MPSNTLLYKALIPLLFVFLWSTGFIGAKYGLPHADPLTFLFMRMLTAALLLYLAVAITNGRWPAGIREICHAATVGVLIHAVYLGGVFVAISKGTDAGFSALIVSLQPLLTVVFAGIWLGESVSFTKIAGIALGLAGVCLVLLADNFTGATADVSQIDFSKHLSSGLLLCLMSLVAITVGTIYQKHFCTKISLLPSVCIQYTAATVVLLPVAATTESMSINWNAEFVFAYLWLVLALSLGAVLLLMWLIKRGNASNVASLFYLVPPFTAFEAWLLFDESLSSISVAGILLSITGVAIIVRNA